VWSLEIANILIQAQRRGRVTADRVERLVGEILRLSGRVESFGNERTLRQIRHLAEIHRLTSYDASYLAAALDRGLPLATQDKDLKAAALAAGVRLVEPLGEENGPPNRGQAVIEYETEEEIV
jgi:predicted nucleic acid-binding protein